MYSTERTKYEKKWAKKIRSALNKQADIVVAAIKSGQTDNTELVRLIRRDSLLQVIGDLYVEVGMAFRKRAKKDIQRQVKAEDVENIDELLAVDMAKYATVDNLSRIVSITETSRIQMLGIITDIIEESRRMGYGVEKTTQLMIDRIPGYWDKQTRWRARLIANTETLTASSYGVDKAYKESGYEYKKTWTNGGRNIRDWHVASKIAAVKGNELFIVDGEKMEYPGDSTHGAGAGNVCNCKCEARYNIIL